MRSMVTRLFAASRRGHGVGSHEVGSHGVGSHRVGSRARAAMLAAGTALGLALASLVAGPAMATAATALPLPTQYTTSPAPQNGNPADPCGVQAPYGYVGLTINMPTFSAVVNGGPTDDLVAAHFQIWPVDSPAAVTDLTSAALPPGDTVRVSALNSV